MAGHGCIDACALLSRKLSRVQQVSCPVCLRPPPPLISMPPPLLRLSLVPSSSAASAASAAAAAAAAAAALLLRAAYQPRHLAHAAVLQLSLPHPLDVLRRGEAPRVEANVADHALEMGRRLLPRNRTRLGHHLDARASAGRKAGIAEGGRVEGQLRAEGAGREREVRHGSPAAGRRDDEKGGPCGGRETGDRIGERLTIIVCAAEELGAELNGKKAGPFHTQGGERVSWSAARCQGQSVFLPSTSRRRPRLCDSHSSTPFSALRGGPRQEPSAACRTQTGPRRSRRSHRLSLARPPPSRATDHREKA